MKKRTHQLDPQRAMLVTFTATFAQAASNLATAVNRFDPNNKRKLVETLGILFGLVQLIAIVAEIDEATLQAETMKYLENVNEGNPLNN